MENVLKVRREAFDQLSEVQQREARGLLEKYEQALKSNPLLGYRPHPKQKVFHQSHEQLKAFLGGNRSGKTTAGILDDLIQAVDQDCLPPHLIPYKKWQPPFYCRIIVPDFTSTLEGVIFQKLREWTPRDQLVGNAFDKAYEKTRRKLSFKNGSWMDFLTFEQDLDKFGGAALHRVHYDEEPPSNIRRESTMRLIDYGGDEIFSMTPLHGMSWMYDSIYEPWTKHQLRDATVVLVDMDDNPHLDERTKRKALEGLTREEREARKSGRFVHFAGMIYGEFSRSEHVIPEICPDETGQRALPAHSNVFVGIDPGIRHMAGVVWTYIDPSGTMVVFDELALQGHNIEEVCEAIKRTNMKWGQRQPDGSIHPLHPAAYIMDPSAGNRAHNTGRSDQSEYTKHGVIAILGQNAIPAGISAVKVRLQTYKLLVAANCQTLIDEFRKYRWATPTRSEDDPKEKPVKADDHLLDALRYVVMSRPYVSQVPEEDEFLSPMERMMKEELEGLSRKQIAKTEYGGIFA